MRSQMKLNDQITIGAQPTEEQLRQLKEQGFRSVVNLRTPDEEDQPLSPAAEGEQVRGLGMEYRHIPVSLREMGPALVDRFREEATQLPGPVYVHCASGKRAGAFGMMHAAVQAGWSGDETLRKADELGFQCDVPSLKEFVKTYVDRRRE